MLDEKSLSDTIPTNIVQNRRLSSNMKLRFPNQRRTAVLSDEQRFDRRTGNEMIIMGFIEPFAKELPMEYAVELNQLIKLEMKGSIG